MKRHCVMNRVAVKNRIYRVCRVQAAIFATFFILVFCIVQIGLLVIVTKKRENSLLHRQVVFRETRNLKLCPTSGRTPVTT